MAASMGLGNFAIEEGSEGEEEEDSSSSSSSEVADVDVGSKVTGRSNGETESWGGPTPSPTHEGEREEVCSERSYASVATSTTNGSGLPMTSTLSSLMDLGLTPPQPRVSIASGLTFYKEEEVGVGGKNKGGSTGGTSRSSKSSIKLDQERLRNELIEKAWKMGVQGRKRLESGITLEVVSRLNHILSVHGPYHFETAYNLVVWIIQNWPCEPVLSTVPVDPWKLGRDCSEMLQHYHPDGDPSDPNNSAFLLPSGLVHHAVGMDAEERRGLVNGYILKKGGELLGEVERVRRRKMHKEGRKGEREGIGELGKTLSKRLYKGINEEIEVERKERKSFKG